MSGAQQWTVGDVTITSIVEMEAPIPGPLIVAEATPEALAPLAWLRPHFVDGDGNIVLRIQALVVESSGRRLVVDTCVGNDKERPIPFWSGLSLPFLADLEGAGFTRESIDTVVCTHLHVDHVGWNTMLVDGEWVPTFPNARYLVGREEWEHWEANYAGESGDIFGDSLRPVVDAGLVDLVETDHRITGEVALEPTPGHTPGHVSVRIRSAGQEAVITGDIMHHPVQCAEPAWAATFDADADLARATRARFLDTHAERDVLVIGTHFAAPTAGRIVRDGAAYRFAVD